MPVSRNHVPTGDGNKDNFRKQAGPKDKRAHEIATLNTSSLVSKTITWIKQLTQVILPSNPT